MYRFLDIFLLAFHAVIIFFNLFGWCFAQTRGIHLIVSGLTLLSWFGMGIWYGVGYCPFTDWHWQVKTKLGETNLPKSYIKYYVDGATGWDIDPALLEITVVTGGVAAFGISAYLNWVKWYPTKGR